MNFQKTVPLIVLSLIAMLWVSNMAQAGYGEAGCGPGSIVFHKNSFVSQSLAQGLNATSSPLKLSAIWTGTSNCSATWSYYKPVERERMEFVADNFWNLQTDVANGQGETLAAVGELHGCDASLNADVLNFSEKMVGSKFDAKNIATQSQKLTEACRKGDHS